MSELIRFGVSIDADLLENFDRLIAERSYENLFNKKYFETQNFFESRVTPTAPIIERIHATPGYSTSVNVGLTFRFGAKN